MMGTSNQTTKAIILCRLTQKKVLLNSMGLIPKQTCILNLSKPVALHNILGGALIGYSGILELLFSRFDKVSTQTISSRQNKTV